MAQCKRCRERDDSPDAPPLSKGQECKRCGVSYSDERASRAEDDHKTLGAFDSDG